MLGIAMMTLSAIGWLCLEVVYAGKFSGDNAQVSRAATAPDVAASATDESTVPLISITRSGSDIIVRFEATQGVTYRLERKFDLVDGSWENIPGVDELVAATSEPAQLTDPGATDMFEQAFYRVSSNQFALTVTRAGSGAGRVTSSPAGIDCGADCAENYIAGTMVTLTAGATTDPAASASLFAGWSGACSGTGDCAVTMDASHSVTAAFNLKPNVAFVTATTHNGNIGGLAGADSICQNAAAAQAIPGTFRAYLSSSNVNAVTRLGTASGWARVDGKPIAGTANDFASGRFFYPLRITNTGVDVGDVRAMTASNGGVFSGSACSDYTSTSGVIVAGATAGQSSMFSSFDAVSCASSVRLYCLGIDRTAHAQVTPPPAQRYVFVSTASWTPGGGVASADAVCQAEASNAALPGTYKALLATTTASAASRFSTSGSPWGRVDGALLAASASSTFTSTLWDTSPGVSADGTQVFGNVGVWSGAANPTAFGTTASTCADWTNSGTGTAVGGRAGFSSVAGYLGFDSSVSCNTTGRRLTCVQQ